MEDTFGKVVSILICAVQMFLIPAYWYNDSVERMEQSYIMSEITYNVDDFRNTGIISAERYESMLNRIYSLSGSYNVKVIHCTHALESESGEYFDTINYKDAIEKALEEKGVYYLNKNDYLNIYVESKKGDVKYCYGGSVKNEAY